MDSKAGWGGEHIDVGDICSIVTVSVSVSGNESSDW